MSDSAHSARRLPRGSHGIPAEVVARNQRERLVAAMAEECEERGYAETSVAAVAKRAGVSSVTFYKQFAGKRECLLAAHRELLGRLLEELDRARGAAGEGEREKSRAALRAFLGLLAADPPTARLLAVEALAAGRRAPSATTSRSGSSPPACCRPPGPPTARRCRRPSGPGPPAFSPWSAA